MSHYMCPICGSKNLPEPPIDAFGYQTYVRCPGCSFTWDDRYSNEELEHMIYTWARKEWKKRNPQTHQAAESG